MLLRNLLLKRIVGCFAWNRRRDRTAICMLALFISLPEFIGLPCAHGTRRRQKNTRQSVCRVLHLANGTRQKRTRQSCLCRVFFVEHSAKTLPSAKLTLGKKYFKKYIKNPSQARAPSGAVFSERDVRNFFSFPG